MVIVEEYFDLLDEFYEAKYNHGYKVNRYINCIDAFEDVPDDEHWSKCPCCNLKPKVWRYNNGRETVCGCSNSMYDIFSVQAESICSWINRNSGNVSGYEYDQLRLNWNEYCATMINPCSHGDLYSEGKW